VPSIVSSDLSVKKDSLLKRIKRDKLLLIMISPGIIYFIIFKYIPYSYLPMAFKDYDIVSGLVNSPWVGFKHFKTFMESPYFLKLVRNTLMINLYDLIFGFPLPIIFALILNEVKNKHFRKAVQTVSYLPHFISTAVVVGMVVNFLSPSTGIINMFLVKVFGIEPIHFLVRPEYFRAIFVSMNIWKSFGWTSIIYFAALTSIDTQLYDAAIVDGAGKWKQMLHVTLPGIKNVIVIMLILKMGAMLEVGFEAIILMYNPLLYDTADVISTFVYRRGIAGDKGGLPDYSFATAVDFFTGIINMTLLVTANWLSSKYSDQRLF